MKELLKRENPSTTGNSKVDGIVNEVAIQLLRNSVVHGIETPEVRSQRGKLPVGHVHMSLKDQGDKFLLTFEDDGNGIDYAAIAQKAVVLGKYTAEEATKLDKRALISLLFTPGFSTAEKSTEDAGRGVGMDIIKDTIQKMGGRIGVSTAAEGYTRFSLYLAYSTKPFNNFCLRIFREKSINKIHYSIFDN